MFTIYALADPETKRIRYVGKTNNPEGRLAVHLSEARHSPRTHVYRWINSLLRQGLRPTLVVCDTCGDESLALELERSWIKLFRMAGLPLTNLTEGGDGVSGLKHTDEAKAKMGRANLGSKRWLGKHHSEDSKVKISLARLGNTNCLGRKLSEETKAKISIAHLGIKSSAEIRAKLSAAQMGNKNAIGNTNCLGRMVSKETKHKMGSGNRGRRFSEKTKAKLSECRKGKAWTPAQRAAHEAGRKTKVEDGHE